MWAYCVVLFAILQPTVHLIRVRADTVEVTDSAQLEVALLNPETTEVLLIPSSGLNEVREELHAVVATLQGRRCDRDLPLTLSASDVLLHFRLQEFRVSSWKGRILTA